MSSFHEIKLELPMALGASGGPERNVDVVRLASGAESRNARWAGSWRRWEIGGAVMRLDQAQELIAFFEARQGRLHGFRFRDPIDWKSCDPGAGISATDQPLGIGDGETRMFQLMKQYADAAGVIDRTTSKPVEGSVLVAVDGADVVGATIDYATGLVTLDEPPAEAAVLTAGYAFDVPARFDMDRLDVALVGNDAAKLLRASVVEIRG